MIYSHFELKLIDILKYPNLFKIKLVSWLNFAIISCWVYEIS